MTRSLDAPHGVWEPGYRALTASIFAVLSLTLAISCGVGLRTETDPSDDASAAALAEASTLPCFSQPATNAQMPTKTISEGATTLKDIYEPANA
jgi:hypothetical protein